MELSKPNAALRTLKPFILIQLSLFPRLPELCSTYLSIEHGTAVLDPFSGERDHSCLRSQKRGIPSIGIDQILIACMIARVKTSPLPPNFDDALDVLLFSAAKIKKAAIPEIPNLDHWFEKRIQTQIARLVTGINNAPDEFRDIFQLALSSILVRVSRTKTATARSAAVQKGIVPEQVPTFLATACRRIVGALAKRDYGLTQAQVIERDTLTVTTDDLNFRVGAVITSPPITRTLMNIGSTINTECFG